MLHFNFEVFFSKSSMRNAFHSKPLGLKWNFVQKTKTRVIQKRQPAAKYILFGKPYYNIFQVCHEFHYFLYKCFCQSFTRMLSALCAFKVFFSTGCFEVFLGLILSISISINVPMVCISIFVFQPSMALQ